MLIDLIPIRRRRPVFHSEPEPEPTESEIAARPWWQRVGRAFSQVQDRLLKAEGHMGRLTRWMESNLKRLVSPEEALLIRIRGTAELTLRHPASWSGDRALRAWRNHLRAQAPSHVIWLVLCLAVLPLMAIITVLPGPNVLGYWFVYRGFCHALAIAGIVRGLHGKIPTRTLSHTMLDGPLDFADPAVITRLAEDLAAPGLAEHLARYDHRRAPDETPETPAEPPPSDPTPTT